MNNEKYYEKYKDYCKCLHSAGTHSWALACHICQCPEYTAMNPLELANVIEQVLQADETGVEFPPGRNTEKEEVSK